MTTNKERIISAEKALLAYNEIKDRSKFQPNDESVIDLLTDLLHWCNYHSVGFDQCLYLAKIHYTEEN